MSDFYDFLRWIYNIKKKNSFDDDMYLSEQNTGYKVNKTLVAIWKKVPAPVGKQLLRGDVLLQGRRIDRQEITTSLKLKHSPFPRRK